MAETDRTDVRLAELVAALSLAVDLGLGQPMEHVLRQTRLALALGEAAGFSAEDRAATYYVSLLAWVGCIADSHELAAVFGDDIAPRAASYEVDLVGLPMFRYLIANAGAGRSVPGRIGVIAQIMLTGGAAIKTSMNAHCEATGDLAAQLQLGTDVRDPLRQAFERWDGKGTPGDVKGDQLLPPIRAVQLADHLEALYRTRGTEAAIETAEKGAGSRFDPVLAALLRKDPTTIFKCFEDESSWDSVIAAEPTLVPPLSGLELDGVLTAFADYIDLKSPYTLGHSRGVAGLAESAATHLGLGKRDVVVLRRAALVHDVGSIGVSSAVWDKPGALSDAERERMRTHPYLTERILARPAMLAEIGSVAAMHHERLDGSGYPGGASGAAIPMSARILAAADVYHAMSEPRPWRAAVRTDDAVATLRDEVRAARLDGDAVDAVLTAAGHRIRRRAELPRGLTGREVEVLRLFVRGRTKRQIASYLTLSPKTVNAHLEHIYTKLGVSTRAAAALFAMRHGLIDMTELAES